MATFTNETGDPVVLPTLDPPVEVAPGESVTIPDDPDEKPKRRSKTDPTPEA